MMVTASRTRVFRSWWYRAILSVSTPAHASLRTRGMDVVAVIREVPLPEIVDRGVVLV